MKRRHANPLLPVLLALSIVVLAGCGRDNGAEPRGAEPRGAEPRGAEAPGAAGRTVEQIDETPPLLLISIDGFRHDYIDRVELPALQRLADGGLRADSLKHVFPTKTFATHYALVTGLHAEGTGVVANNMWDPAREASFSLGNRDAVGDGYWYDGEPIWNTVEKAGKTAATYFWPGSEAQIGGMRPSMWKPYAGDTPHDQRVDQVLDWLDLPTGERPVFLTLYFSAVDSAGHRHGPMHPETAAAMRDVDDAIARLIAGLEQRGLFGRMHVLVTSDHGMHPIDLDRYVLLDKDLGVPLDRVHVSDWGPAAQIWTQPEGPSADEIVAKIGDQATGVRRVWKKGGGPKRYHFDEHQRVPDVTVEAELGWMISNQPYYAGMQRGLLNGMHGWDPAWHSMHGIFIAHGPAFEAGERLPAVRSVDLYPLMAELMAVPPAETDGRLAAFEPLLGRAAPVGVTEQAWQCADGRRYRTRRSPGLVALHDGGLVFSLPRAGAESAMFGGEGVSFRVAGSTARIEVDGRVSGDCRPAAPMREVSRPART